MAVTPLRIHQRSSSTCSIPRSARVGRGINAGAVEDVATGSAAGPAAAYLIAHGLAAEGESIIINQGRFLGRR
jgi:predicted PhzF superfamily epimerase YddE/YHI9